MPQSVKAIVLESNLDQECVEALKKFPKFFEDEDVLRLLIEVSNGYSKTGLEDGKAEVRGDLSRLEELLEEVLESIHNTNDKKHALLKAKKYLDTRF